MTEPAVSVWQLARTFNRIALASFGGGLSAWSRQVVVEEKQWMSEEEFLSASTVCRLLPGANQINFAVFVGTKLRGLSGAIAAVLGLIMAPVVVVLVLGALYAAHRHAVYVEAALRGMTSAAVALSLAMAYKTGRACLRNSATWGMCVAAFLLAGVLRVPLIALLAVLGPLGMWWAWPRRAPT
jgi:chromate transporter